MRFQNNYNFICMSNLANYSPYNKTYKFIVFQNQAYHQRNKRNASPCVRTNLRHSMSRLSSSAKNPQNFELLLSNLQSPRHSVSPDSKTCRSMLFQNRKQIERARISESKRIIHKHQSYQKFKNQRISHENMSMVSRILGSQCQIITKSTAQKAYERHIRFQNIKRRYNESGERKDCISLGDSKLLCPTLMSREKIRLKRSQYVNKTIYFPEYAQKLLQSCSELREYLIFINQYILSISNKLIPKGQHTTQRIFLEGRIELNCALYRIKPSIYYPQFIRRELTPDLRELKWGGIVGNPFQASQRYLEASQAGINEDQIWSEKVKAIQMGASQHQGLWYMAKH